MLHAVLQTKDPKSCAINTICNQYIYTHSHSFVNNAEVNLSTYIMHAQNIINLLSLINGRITILKGINCEINNLRQIGIRAQIQNIHIIREAGSIVTTKQEYSAIV